MKKNFLKSVASGIAVLALTSACSTFSAKESSHKCGGKNSCKSKSSKHKCSSNGCSSNGCSSKRK